MKSDLFGRAIRSDLQETGAHEVRADFLPEFMVREGRCTIIELGGELIPVNRDGIWTILIWPTEDEARVTWQHMEKHADRSTDVAYIDVNLARFRENTLAYAKSNGETITAFPDKHGNSNVYEPKEFEARLDWLENAENWQRARPRLKADVARRERLLKHRRGD